MTGVSLIIWLGVTIIHRIWVIIHTSRHIPGDIRKTWNHWVMNAWVSSPQHMVDPWPPLHHNIHLSEDWSLVSDGVVVLKPPKPPSHLTISLLHQGSPITDLSSTRASFHPHFEPQYPALPSNANCKWQRRKPRTILWWGLASYSLRTFEMCTLGLWSCELRSCEMCTLVLWYVHPWVLWDVHSRLERCALSSCEMCTRGPCEMCTRQRPERDCGRIAGGELVSC